MEITAAEWGDLRQDVGIILAQTADLPEIRTRVDKLERDSSQDKIVKKQNEDRWNRRDKTYLRLFAAVGSIGAVVSMAVVVAQSFGG